MTNKALKTDMTHSPVNTQCQPISRRVSLQVSLGISGMVTRGVWSTMDQTSITAAIASQRTSMFALEIPAILIRPLPTM